MAVREYTDKSGVTSYFLNCYPEGRKGKRVNIPLPSYLSSKAEAEDYLKSIELNLGNKGRLGPSGSTIAELWQSYLLHIQREKQPTTYVDVEIAGRHIAKVLGNIQPKFLDKGHIDLYKDSRLAETHGGKQISRRSVNKELSWLSGFLSWCEDTGIETPQGLTITRFKYRRPIPILPSIEEAMRIIFAAEPLYRSMFGCLYLCGMRFTEAQLLKREDVNDQTRQALVTGKGNKQRLIPIPAFLLEWINELKPAGSKGYIHTQRRNADKPVFDLRTALRRAAKKAGVTKHVYPHLMRHCFASHALTEWDVDIKTLQRYLGHSSLQATEWYLHTSEMNVQRAGKAMERSVQALVDSFSTRSFNDAKDEEIPFSTC